MNSKIETGPIREVFLEAAEYYVATVNAVAANQWDLPGLGVWNIRALVGHTSRALLTVEQYSAEPLTETQVDSAITYFVRALNEADSNEIADRGKSAGIELGADPAGTVRSIADRVLQGIANVPDEAILGTPRGAVRMVDYLQTRVFELTVHTMDIQAALNQPLTPPQPALLTTMRILADLAVAQGRGADVALALTGRNALAWPFKLLP